MLLLRQDLGGMLEPLGIVAVTGGQFTSEATVKKRVISGHLRMPSAQLLVISTFSSGGFRRAHPARAPPPPRTKISF